MTERQGRATSLGYSAALFVAALLVWCVAGGDRPAAAGVLSDCDDNLAYVSDVTLPDNAVVVAGQVMKKTWRVRNSGTCRWSGDYRLAFVGGERMGADARVEIPEAAPGQSLDLTLTMTMPVTSGLHTGIWRMVNPSGKRFGDPITIVVRVPGAAPQVTPVPTPAANPARQFSGRLEKWYSNCGVAYVKGKIVDRNGDPVNGLRVRVWADGWDGALSLVSGVGLTYGPGEWDVLLRQGQSGNFYVQVWDWQTGADTFQRVDSDLLVLDFNYSNENCQPDRDGHQVAQVLFTRNY